MSKFIFVTGGVVSSLGKGIAVASIGRMLKSRRLSVSVLKLDPYLNVDPGTMSPYQHGEVFVTVDGSETDLDLGHYERFIDVELTELSNVTAGQIYSEVIANERAGQYLGGTIQTVPHVTNLIKERILRLADESKADVVVVEVGGTVGDIEGQPFIEAIRQVRNTVGQLNTFYVHVTLLPYLGATGELKTKPTQHSVNTLRGMGVQPDAILCRADQETGEDERRKIALYCDVKPEAVISLPTLPSVYEVPLHLEAEGLGKILVNGLELPDMAPDLESWRTIVRVDEEEHPEIEIALVGKYVELQDSYLSVVEALHHAGLHNDRKINIEWIAAEDIEEHGAEQLLSSARGIIVPGGFGERGLEGMIAAANYARKSNVPYLGLCLGMQIMVVEYARNELGIADATSLEIDPEAANPVIAFMDGQEELHSTGGTMRLGLYPCALKEGTRVREAYGEETVDERHRHRYEFNNEYRLQLEEAGLVASGTSPDGSLVEVTEVYGHPFMVGSQFHPEFGSRPERPHPLFREFIKVSRSVLREGGQHDLFEEQE
ncbi:MAG TPA: CTP synthase [Dehalococcoidia bacterium]|nr:CTP synthetase [Alphaproteobacteria bacterium]HCI85247.1 CTP synthase [Dehalococcoidia bacterium]|tara:strand:+ start:3130 stop:4767 length:1638 start_codon:yes stop_codon:yes gene_type:complete